MFFSIRHLYLYSIGLLFFLFFTSVSVAQVTTPVGALHFDGTNDHVVIPRDSSLDMNTAITIESWIYPTNSTRVVQSVISKSSATQNNGFVFPRTDKKWQNLAFYLNFNGKGWVTLVAPYPGINAWHHVAATYDGVKMRLYIDGVMVKDTSVTGTITINTNALAIGTQTGFSYESYYGKVDESRIWNRALTQCEIASAMNCEFTGPQNGLVAYYKFNQGVFDLANPLETALTDASGYNKHGTLTNFALNGAISNWVDGKVSGTCAPFVTPVATAGNDGPQYAVGSTVNLTATGGASYSWSGPNGFTSTLQNPSIPNAQISASGTYTVTVTSASGCTVTASTSVVVAFPARGLNFDGEASQVDVSPSPLLNTGTAITLEAWIYPTNGNTGIQDVVSKSTNETNNSYIFPRTDDAWQNFIFYLHIEGVGWKRLSAPYPGINSWHHLAATYDGFFMRIYLDGQLKNTLAVTGKISANDNFLTIGQQPGLIEHFRGDVDEIRIWNRALTQCEIQNNLNCELNGVQTGLVAYYKFNQGLLGVDNTTVTTLTDASGNNLHGTLKNFLLNGVNSNWNNGNASGTCAVFAPINAVAGNNGPVIAVGTTLQLTSSGGTSYSWNGPNGFSSSLQNPSLPDAQTVNSGTYTVAITSGSCTSTIGTKVKVAYLAGTLHFDGENDQVIVPAGNSLNIRSGITLESWIYPTDTLRPIQNVMCKSTRDVNNGYIFPRTDDGWKSFVLYLHVNGKWKHVSAPYPGINQWHHLAATYDGFHIRLYLDGVLAATEEATGEITINTNNLVMGQQPGFNEYFMGKFEETRLWNRALNQCEIINNMNCELQAQQTGLVAYYKYNQGFLDTENTTVTTLTDASGNNNNGTLTNFALDGLESNWAALKISGTCTTYAQPPVEANSNGAIFGVGSTLRLFASGGFTYYWTGPAGFSDSAQNTVRPNLQPVHSGTYTVAAPFVKCVIYASTRVEVTNLPGITANGPTTFCPSGSVTLSIATTGTAYQWYRNDTLISGANAISYVATKAGNYHVAVTVNNSIQVLPPITTNVVDNLVPVPNTASLPALQGETPATINTYPTATDNCAGQVTARTSDPLTFTAPGTYTIRWIYDDGNGNTTMQTQEAVIVSGDLVPPVLAGVPANVTVNCSAIPAPAAVTVSDNADPNPTLVFSQTSTQSGDVNNIAHYNYTITRTWKASDVNTNTVTAVQVITVADQSAPVITGITDKNVPADANSAGAMVHFAAVVSDNCNSPVTTAYSNAPGSFFAIGATTVTVTATDLAGNSSTKSFVVTVADNQPPAITAPANITVNTDNGVAYASNVVLGTATASDNSGGTVTITNTAPVQYPLGVTTVTWTAKDSTGNTATATQTITVVDNQLPAITAPANITVSTDSGVPYASNVVLGVATASDNSGSVTITNNAPAQYPIGVTTVTWTAKDAAGNTATAAQQVTVLDKQLPTITAPADVTVNTNAGVNYATGVVLGSPVTGDNSGSSVTVTNNAPSHYSLGVTIVTWTAKDASNNAVSGTQKVTVIDNQAPTVNPSADITIVSATAVPASSVALGTAITVDNVGVVSIINDAPAQYPVGTTIVTWTAKDSAGNTGTATQKVIVQAPANCSGSITVVPSNNTYTGGVPTNLYIGYGPQSDTLKVTATGGTQFTYAWKALSGNGILSSTSSASPVFAPVAAGYYTFEVKITAGSGCTTTKVVSICVKDIRVLSSSKDDNDNGNEGIKCDHKSHTFRRCAHKGHDHHSCDHKEHSSKDCDDRKVKNDKCDHKSHNSRYCGHKGHQHQCDHNSHSRKDCKDKGDDDDDDDDEGGKKVYLCHVAPGNGKQETLKVSVNAVAQHLANHTGDKLGGCDQQACTVYKPDNSFAAQTVTAETASTDKVKEAQAVEEMDLKLTVMGNPSYNYFIIQLQSSLVKPVNMRVMDMHGRAIEEKNNIRVNSTIQIGHNYPNGAYFAEFRQGSRRKIIQLIRLR